MDDITLAVLAGGEGTRMGFPKQNLTIANRPILEYLSDRIAWTGPTLLVTTPGRERPPGAARFDAEAVDTIPNQGPLRGVLTALENAKTELLIITTVDMPGIEQTNLRWMIDRLTVRAELQGLMLQRTIHGKMQIEPFPFACRREIGSIVTAWLAEGRRSVHPLAAISGFAVETAPHEWSPVSWTNFNSPEDYQSFMRSFQG